MKNLKKQSFALTLGLSMFLGSALAFFPAKAEVESSIPLYCWTASKGYNGTHLNCFLCKVLIGKPKGPKQMGCDNVQ